MSGNKILLVNKKGSKKVSLKVQSENTNQVESTNQSEGATTTKPAVTTSQTTTKLDNKLVRVNSPLKAGQMPAPKVAEPINRTVKSNQITSLQSVLVGGLNAIDHKVTNIYKAGDHNDLFGINKRGPAYHLDVEDNINARGEYYLRGNPLIPVGTVIQNAGELRDLDGDEVINDILPPDDMSETDINNNCCVRVHNHRGKWLLCDGSFYDHELADGTYTEFKRLYDVIGTKYGSSTVRNFRVPNLVGRVIVGAGDFEGGRLAGGNPIIGTLNDNKSWGVGETGGEAIQRLYPNQIPQHNHYNDYNEGGGVGANGVTGGVGDHSHNISGVNTNSTGAHSHTINNFGGVDPHNNMQPFVVMNYFIRS